MRVVIPTIGSRGDVQPFIALAQGLERAGYAVRLLSHPGMGELASAHGVPFAAMGPDVNMAQEGAAILQRSGHMLTALPRLMTLAFDILGQAHNDILVACQEADLVIVPASSAAGKNEAELLDLPTMSVDFMPWTIEVNAPQRSLFRRVLYSAVNKLVTSMTIRPLNKLRRQQGLPPVGPEGFRSTHLNLVPISPLVYAPNPYWAPIHKVVGYWFVEEPRGWQAPDKLQAFLDGDPPPVAISLGAMSQGPTEPGGRNLETATLFVKAIEAASVRAIVQGWETALKQLDLPSSIYPAGPLPHSWLLPRTSGLVHHGGFGTTAAGFRAGIPQLIVPHLADQFYWGKRVQELGVGLSAISPGKLSVEKLAAALTELTHRDEQRAIASQLGEGLRAERGVGEAIHLISEAFGGPGN